MIWKMVKINFNDSIDELSNDVGTWPEMTSTETLSWEDVIGEYTPGMGSSSDDILDWEDEPTGWEIKKETEETIKEETPTTETSAVEESTEKTDTTDTNSEDVGGSEIETLLKELDTISDKSEDISKDVETVVQNSDISKEEKDDLLNRIREKDDMLEDLQIKLETIMNKYKDVASQKEEYELDWMLNKKFNDKLQSDPDTQEFISLKIKSDAWDERATTRLEEFYKDRLNGLGYDIDALVRNKKMTEKQAMSKEGYAPSYTTTREDIDEMDAIDSLFV